ncbi:MULTISPECIES: YegP family protein [Tatumella]|uniref:YegP family protein n=1 Tax=Tatumella punctata TaxID=399969 RepID=A0ABW1VJL6_9GAMM|nr:MULTISPECIES: YegP family protein [unclassified Tatumella]MBS0856474.1 YegP family protein [Tatumella sp. JGM16]MBS0876212.1 YegP family protein [Tatumella sp. JGM82]MBS0889261.1 YegP family protein [Tatumella sp. JGM94]MBS0893605.1 YegP family protein [Tatumella sp. JGM130]MBS0902325.1 YegP family protein [Tatumella sp. JGM100]
MSGKYDVFRGKDQQYYFHLKAANGEVILSSEGYKEKSGCLNGIISVQKNSADDHNYQRLTAKNGAPYFTLKAQNHQVIGCSEMYSTVAAREKGIESVKKNGPDSPVTELSAE